MMKIIVDAFGGDNAPLEIIKGCVEAAQEYKDVQIIMTGNENIIRHVAKQNNICLDGLQIVTTNSVISMHDAPNCVLKEKADSSMAVGLQMVAKGEADGFVSAGNSGALTFGASMIVKRIKGIKRAAFAASVPKMNGHMLLLDSGANVDCRPEMLYQFGIMGAVYMEKVMGIQNPRVGLANVGEEEHKGTELYQETYQLLKADPRINFVGNVEARDMPNDVADVIVADGFTGNMILKTYEGVGMFVLKMMKDVFYKSTKNKLAGAMIKGDLDGMKKTMNYHETGGAPVMGATKPIFKAHGSSKAVTVKNAIRLTRDYIANDVVGVITDAVKREKRSLEKHED